MAGLAHQVLVHDPALGGPPRGNLPAPTTALVGRAAELAAVRAALDEHRLVTVVGPAGVGKTRLAVEAARGRQAPDGTWLARLEGVRTADELPTALAEALPGHAGHRRAARPPISCSCWTTASTWSTPSAMR